MVKLRKYSAGLWRLIQTIPRQLLHVDLIRAFVGILRATVLIPLNGGIRIYQGDESFISPHTLRHNLKGLWQDLFAARPHILIQPLMSIDYVRKNISELKVLSVGPRSENELLTLMEYGFRSKNIISVDLISYSPKIKLGDIHNLPLDSDSYDIVICGWTLAYSENKRKAASELVRVVKSGGIIAVSATSHPATNEELEEQLGYVPGSRERLYLLEDLEKLFEGSMGWPYFRHERGDTETISHLISIFEAKKSHE